MASLSGENESLGRYLTLRALGCLLQVVAIFVIGFVAWVVLFWTSQTLDGFGLESLADNLFRFPYAVFTPMGIAFVILVLWGLTWPVKILRRTEWPKEERERPLAMAGLIAFNALIIWVSHYHHSVAGAILSVLCRVYTLLSLLYATTFGVCLLIETLKPEPARSGLLVRSLSGSETEH